MERYVLLFYELKFRLNQIDSILYRYMSPSQRFALGAGIDKAKVIQMKGLTKIGELDFNAENYKQVEPVAEIPDEFDWNTQQNIKIEEKTTA